jgi:hypothetical protein
MKHSFLLAVMSFASFHTAHAAPAAASPCPVITGSFYRQDGQGFEVKTTIAGGRWIYQLANFTAVADGKERKIKADGGSATLVAMCERGSLLISQKLVRDIQEVPAEGEDELVPNKEQTNWMKLTPYDKNVLEVETSRPALNGIYVRGKAPKKHEPMN